MAGPLDETKSSKGSQVKDVNPKTDGIKKKEDESSSNSTTSSKKDSPKRWASGTLYRPAITPQTEGAEWRTWPWRVLGDDKTYWFGMLILALPGPFMAVLIGTATISMEILRFFWRLSPFPSIFPPLIKAWADKWGQKLLRDPRNSPFLPHMLWLCTWIPALFLYAAYRHTTYGFEWIFFFIYHFLRIGPRFRFFAHLHVLVHREGHEVQGLFKPEYWYLNYWPMQWLVGPFFGQVPNSYGVAHNKIHHRYDNGLDDVHTNLDLDRTKFSSYVIFVPRFLMYWAGFSPLVYFINNEEYVLARKMAKGMLYHTLLFAVVAYWNFTFAIAYLAFPFFEAVIFFSGIAYLWHCWVDPKDPYNPYVTSVTIVDGHDNIWNEDYHVIHHDNISVHWSLAKEFYEEHKAEYAANGATIFQDTEEGRMLFFMLTGNWDELAKSYVDLNGKMTHEDKKKLLIERASFVIQPVEQKLVPFKTFLSRSIKAFL